VTRRPTASRPKYSGIPKRTWREELGWWRDFAELLLGKPLCWAGVHHDTRRYAMVREASCLRCGESLP
jgi:hypothetical protein